MIPSFERFLTWWAGAARMSRLAWAIAGSLLWWLASPAFGAQPFVKIQPGIDSEFAGDVEFQTAETDADSGALFVTGTFITRVDFSAAVSLVAPFKGIPQAFLAKQNVDGNWEWAVLAYSLPAPTPRNEQAARMLPSASQEVKDIEVTADGIYLCGTLKGTSSARSGWAAKFNRSGVRQWIRYFQAADAVVSAIGVNSLDGAVYVGGSAAEVTFKPSMVSGSFPVEKQETLVIDDGTGANSLAKISAVGDPRTSGYDAFIVKFSSAGAYQWNVRAGSGIEDQIFSYDWQGFPTGPRSLAVMEEVAALEVDGAGTLHVLMNVAGSESAGKGREVKLLDQNRFVRATLNTGCYIANGTQYCTFGSPATVAGRLGSDGVWQAYNNLTEGDDLAAASVVLSSGGSVKGSRFLGTDLALVDGKVVVVGSYQIGTLPLLGAPQWLAKQGFMARVSQETYEPDGPVVYFKSLKTDAGQDAYPTRVRGAGSQIFVTGRMQRTLRVYSELNHATATLGDYDRELTSLKATQFIASFDPQFTLQMLRTTTLANEELSPERFTAPMVAYDVARDRVYWGGGFAGTNRLVLGDIPILSRSGPTGPKDAQGALATYGWLTAFGSDRRFALQSTLAVRSDFGPVTVGSQSFSATDFVVRYFVGTELTLSVPEQVPASLTGVNTRRLARGFQVNGSVVSGDATRYTLTLLQDTSVRFAWETQHRLIIDSDHASVGLDDTAAAGLADPPLGDTWVKEGDLVTAFIDGVLYPVDQLGLGTRWVTTGFNASGSVLNSVDASAGVVSGLNSFSDVVERHQVPQFTMNAPGTIQYRWKKQHRVQVSASIEAGSSLLLSRQVGAAASFTRDGEYWFDAGSTVQLGARQLSGGLALNGWRNADPTPASFPVPERIAPPGEVGSIELFLSGDLSKITVGGQVYLVRQISNFSAPTRVTWDFGNAITRIDVPIGTAVRLTPDLGAFSGTKPSAVRLVDGPPGSTVDDMQIWDGVAKVVYPLRPGIFFLDWPTATGTAVAQIYAGFPGDPIPNRNGAATFNGTSHYRHVANTYPEVTPPVDLDPDPTDAFQFLSAKYVTGQSRVTGKQYTATGPGRAVLLFSQAVDPLIPASGNLNVESLRVRVAETKDWKAVLGNPGDTQPFSYFDFAPFYFRFMSPASGTPTRIVTADFDRDGKLDVLNGPASALILGTGSLDPITAGSLQTLVHGANDVAVGDLNGDGYPDLVESFVAGGRAVYLNNRTRTPFATIAPLRVGPGLPATSRVALADVNGDGRLDLIAARSTTGIIEVFYNAYVPDTENPEANTPERAAATVFPSTPSVTFTLPGFATGATFMVLGDVNGDGRADLVVGRATVPLRVYLSAGGDTPFTTPISMITQVVSPDMQDVVLSDVDGDGRLDLVWINRNPFNVRTSTLFLHINNGTPGAFGNATIAKTFAWDVAGQGLPQRIAVGDVTGDGRRDVVVSSVTPAANFTYFVRFENSGTSPYLTGNGALAYSRSQAFLAIGLADMNGDGELDLVGGTSTGIGVLMNQGNRNRYRDGTIGSRVTSGFDTAGLRTGYLIRSNALYNAELYDRTVPKGPIIPVNRRVFDSMADPLVVVWYERVDSILWPHQPVQYDRLQWPVPATAGGPTEGKLGRIVIASRIGSEGLDASGNRQTVFDPARYSQLKIYNQPNRNLPGYNPNEEHARLYPSLLGAVTGLRTDAAFALRNDLNISQALITAQPAAFAQSDYTSDPYVLLQYFDTQDREAKMAVYAVEREDATTRDAWLPSVPGATGDSYVFTYKTVAGELLQPPYPLNLVQGLNPCVNTVPNLFSSPGALPNGSYYVDGNPAQRTWLVDHKGSAWVVSGDSTLFGNYFYRLPPDFWYPFDRDTRVKQVGQCIPFLPEFAIGSARYGVFDTSAVRQMTPRAVQYLTTWPANPAILKVGETLTFAGGENKADNPDAPGLPGVIGWASGEVVFDSKNPGMLTSGTPSHFDSYMVRLISPLEERKVGMPKLLLPPNLSPASSDVIVEGDSWLFAKLSPSLQKRIFYRPLSKLNANGAAGVLGIRGFVNDKTLGDPALTAAPPPVYVLEPNVLTESERDELLAIGSGSGDWDSAVRALYDLCRNPSRMDRNNDGSADTDAWNVGLQPAAVFNATGTSSKLDASKAAPLQALGAGLAVVTNPRLLDPTYRPSVGWVTLAENNHPALGDAPVSIHVIKVDTTKLFRGAIKTIAPPNVFDEKITLLHNADFGGNVANVSYAWWYHEEDGTVHTGQVPPGAAPEPIWNAFENADGVDAQNRINLNGNPVLLLADNLFFVRYRYKDDLPASTARWSDWAGAANSSIQDLDGDRRPDFRGQLATGWVKRVLDGINPYEARVRDMTRNDSPATASSMVQLLGGPFVGPVALNASKDVVENVGLIELYETVLKRARDLSIDASQPAGTPGITAAILLASTRLADFYTLLGHEAWDDALDPTIGFGNDALGADSVEHGALSSTRFCFENQLPSLLDEELVLLRGLDQSYGRPVFNRLMWNLTKGEGEVAYALNYQISDVNHDGFRDEHDALTLYPQGHGDAWGHYLSAMRKRYDLLRHPIFNWDARSEAYNILDVVVGVDFLDEKKFAQTAAARAQVGAEIVNLTYRARYTEDPDGQWQGYLDTDAGRAWGVTEWARRAGQAAYFDWLTANALVPFQDPDPSHTGLSRIDRKTLGSIAEVSANFAGIQVTLDTSNRGLNPLGLDPDVVPFDIDPTHIDVGSTAQIGRAAVQGLSHFEQIFERAYEAMRNANAALSHANEQKVHLRNINTSAEQLRAEAVAQDLEFRNRLIEIFGTPYEGTIGAGKPYPPGYTGADLNLFMYVDVNAVSSDTVPQPAESYRAAFAGFHELFMDVPVSIGTEAGDAILKYYRKYDGSEDNTVTGNSSVELLGEGAILHLGLPATAEGYTFVAPPGWGQRAAPGQLQQQVSDILQSEADLAVAVSDYDFLQKQMRDKVEYLKVKVYSMGSVIGVQETLLADLENLDGEIHDLLIGAGITSASADLAMGIAESVEAGFPDVNGVDNDFAFAGESITLLVGSLAKFALDGVAVGLESMADEKEREKERLQIQAEIDAAKLEIAPEMVGIFNEIEELLVNEGVTRIKVFGIRERLRGQLDQYRATLQQGLRLLEERRNANATIASSAQENRYHDILFRSSRHESIQRYRSLYDLAQRYCYMAAKAFDYETNFDPDDRASVQPLLESICKERALGELADGYPLNRGGLAGIMARIQDNFRAIEGRLGFNNVQIDTTSFSLRKEMARSASDSAWMTTLAGFQVTDLWRLPEFRRYCRPFAPRTAIAQPGIVVRFGSQVVAGTNFFGKPLGGGDSTFDPTMYATKIRASGIHFDGYPLSKLTRTPYVYLVPTGNDVMIVPDSPRLQTRVWNVVDQAIPVPNLTGAADLGRPNWLPLVDSLSGPLGAIRRYSSFRAGVLDDDPPLVATRLIGRSVWNTGWMLIIPGQTLHNDPATGLREFINNVSDITLTFETYGYSGN